MASVAELVARVRSHGANITLDAGKLRIVNGKKLPDGALDFIKKHSAEVAAFLDNEGEFDERAAIIEFDGGLTRPAAEYLTKLLMSHPPSGASGADWSWFVGQAAKVMDDVPMRRAA